MATISPKVRIERLYGVDYGGLAIALRGLLRTGLDLTPSPQMLKELEELGEGARVGIERLSYGSESAMMNMRVGGTQQPFDLSSYYLDQLHDHCVASGIKVVYLESQTLLLEHMRMRIALSELSKTRPGTESEQVRLGREIYRITTEEEYLYMARRGNAMIAGMVKSAPLDAVVIRNAHANLFWQMQNSGRLEQVAFGSYKSDEMPELREDDRMLWAGFVSSSMFSGRYDAYRTRPDQDNSLNHDPVLNALYPAHMLQLERKKKALDEGRITDGDPDFIGTWDMKLPLYGLFEMTIMSRNGSEVRGVIEDVLGRATFTGTVDCNGAVFVKLYDTGVPHILGAVQVPTEYRASLEGGVYSGSYGHMDQASDFVMARPGAFARLLRDL